MLDFVSILWRHEGNAAWHFVTIPEDVSDEIAAQNMGPRRGFGSMRVRVTVGDSTWDTSVFPDSKTHCYVLPVKKPVRAKEGLVADATVAVSLKLLD